MSAHRRAAERRWPDAIWIVGTGAYAVLSYCPHLIVGDALTVELHDRAEDAITARWRIDIAGCGALCHGEHGHRIERLAATTVRRRRAA